LFGQIPYELVQTPPWNSELLAGSLLQMVHCLDTASPKVDVKFIAQEE
jgi:hypothetical protein